MAIISVEVPDNIAIKYSSYKVVPSLELYEELEKNSILIDFWKSWIWKKDFEKYLSIKSSL